MIWKHWNTHVIIIIKCGPSTPKIERGSLSWRWFLLSQQTGPFYPFVGAQCPQLYGGGEAYQNSHGGKNMDPLQSWKLWPLWTWSNMNKYKVGKVIIISSAEMILHAFKIWWLQRLHVLISWNIGNRTQMDPLQPWKLWQQIPCSILENCYMPSCNQIRVVHPTSAILKIILIRKKKNFWHLIFLEKISWLRSYHLVLWSLGTLTDQERSYGTGLVEAKEDISTPSAPYLR